MLENIGKYYILDAELKKSADYEKKEYDARIYEVIRVVDGNPLFLDDHFDRLKKSAELLNEKLPLDIGGLKIDIDNIIEANEILNNNLMLITYYGKEGSWYVIYFRKSFYPCIDMYKDGVDTELFKLKRENPNAKILNLEYRNIVNEQITKNKVFEIILVDENDVVTEGSRTNVFLYKDNCFYTAPSQLVLIGITRKYIIDIIKNLGFGFEEKEITTDELSGYEGAFLSGTSIGVLPISQIGDLSFDTTKTEAIYKVMKKYNSFIKANIQSC